MFGCSGETHKFRTFKIKLHSVSKMGGGAVRMMYMAELEWFVITGQTVCYDNKKWFIKYHIK